jgi:predicted DNA-binding ribbon-helix-helix protein
MELRGAPQNFTSLLRSACLIYTDNRLATRLEDQRQLKAS